MTWPAAFLALLVSHAVGDVLLQTNWQAMEKVRGMDDRVARRALLSHVAAYTLAFVPALIWIAADSTIWRAIAVAAIVAIPHLLIDDGRIVRAWLRQVKGTTSPALGLTIAVDQTFHVLCLLGAALVVVR